jgi:hypothetical protein
MQYEKVITSIYVSFTHLGCMVPPQSPPETPQPQNLFKKPYVIVLDLNEN